MSVTLDRKIEALEKPYRPESAWKDADVIKHYQLTQRLITQVGSYTDIEDGQDNCPSVKARVRKHRGTEINFDNTARDKAIRFDFVYMGLTVKELQTKWGLSQANVYRSLGGMRNAVNRRVKAQKR